MDTLDLTHIARQLEALEETIIHKLVDRAQFMVNQTAYLPGKSGFRGEDTLSLFDVRLKHHEQMDSLFGRFEVPEERPFTSELPAPRRMVSQDTHVLRIPDFNEVNLTEKIRGAYLDLVPRLCPAGDDGQYGSSVEHDVIALQAISRRIHYGAMYVAESKYRGNEDKFKCLVSAGDPDALGDALTRPEVEERIFARVPEKVRRIQEDADRSIRIRIDPDLLGLFYRETVIPLTKEGEVRYLLCRRID